MRLTPVCRGIVALLALSPLFSPAHSADNAHSLGEVTVSATRTERKVDSVPNTVTVLGERRLRERDAKDLKDLLDGEVDLAVNLGAARFTAAGSPQGRAGSEGLNIRGLEGNRVLALVDGIRLPQTFTFGPFASGRLDYLDTDTLAGVEVLRGPASTQFGSDGLGGALTLRTLAPEDLLADGRTIAGFVKAGALSADRSAKATAAMAGRAGRNGEWTGLLLATLRRGHALKTEGTNDAPNLTRTTANPADIDGATVLAKAGLKIDARHRLQAALEARRRTTDTEVLSARAVTGSAQTPVIGLTAHDVVERQRVSLEHSFEDLNAGWLHSLRTLVYAQHSETRQHSDERRFAPPDRTRDGRYEERLTGLSTLGLTQLAGQRLSYGLELSRNRIETLRDGTPQVPSDPFPNKPFPDTAYTLVGAFLQDELELGDFSLTPGLRFDHYSLKPDAAGYRGQTVALSDRAITPRLGGVWRISPQFQPYAQWALGFRAPAPDQVNNGFANPTQGYTSIGNPDLKPEHANSIEVGLRGRIDEALRWQLSAYDNRYRDFIDQRVVSGAGTPADPAVYQYINLREARIRGVEARLVWQPLAGLTLDGALAVARGHSRAADSATDAPLDTVQPTRSSVGARYEIGDWVFHGRWHHAEATKRASVATNFLPPRYDVLDLGASWRLQKGLLLSALVTNATDARYWRWSDLRGVAATSPVLDGYTAPGRALQVSLRADF